MRRRAASTAVLLVLAVAGPAAAQTATTRSAVGDLPFTVPALRIDAPVAGLEGVAAGADHRCVATETLLWPLAPGDPRRDGIVETTLDRLRDRGHALARIDAPGPGRAVVAEGGTGTGLILLWTGADDGLRLGLCDLGPPARAPAGVG
jgi:hypothetical protein